jgi:hypothetical protein
MKLRRNQPNKGDENKRKLSKQRDENKEIKQTKETKIRGNQANKRDENKGKLSKQKR